MKKFWNAVKITNKEVVVDFLIENEVIDLKLLFKFFSIDTFFENRKYKIADNPTKIITDCK
jgi:hypothetical protein